MSMRTVRVIRKNRYGGVLLALAFLIGLPAPPNVFAQISGIDWQQCRNDTGEGGGTANDETVDNCSWTDGGINATNGVYREGDAVPQRLFAVIENNGPHTLRFSYDFSKGNIYAYDFLTRPDAGPQIGPLLNACGQLPGSVTLGTCNSLFS